MVITHGVNNTVYSNLGAADCSTAATLRFIAIRKNTKKQVTINILIVYQDPRWIVFNIDGALFQAGEHNYSILDSLDNELEKGILIVKNGTEEISEFDSGLEGE